jgi:hypothetical protein
MSYRVSVSCSSEYFFWILSHGWEVWDIIQDPVWTEKGQGSDGLPGVADEVEPAFHLKNQILAAFLDIARAYDNVLMSWTSCAGSLRKKGSHYRSYSFCGTWCGKSIPTFLMVRTWHLCAPAIRVYSKDRFYLHSCTTFSSDWLRLICILCARFYNMRMILLCIGTACRRLWQDRGLALGTWVSHCLQTSQKWRFFQETWKFPGLGAARSNCSSKCHWI